MMHCVEGMKLRPARRVQNFEHIWNAMVYFGDCLHAIPEFTALGNEVVVRIDDDKCSRLFVERQICHGWSPFV